MVPRESLEVQRLPGRPDDGVEAILVLRLRSDLTLVDRAVDVLLAQCFAGGDPDQRTRFRARVAVAEAITNAMERGNRGDPSKEVAVEASLHADCIRVGISDQGPGFDPAQVPDPTQPGLLEHPCGRGLFLIRSLAEAVEFNDKGNTIWMTLPRW